MTAREGQTFENVDYSGADWSDGVVTRCIFKGCTFDGVNMQRIQAVGAQFIMCSMERTDCYRANFMDAVFPGTVFNPSDCYGATFTLTCKTFENTRVGQLWWYLWLMMIVPAVPDRQPVCADLKALLISFIGDNRYLKLKALLARRQY